MSETSLIKKIQIRASELGARLFRNNCGSLQNKNGRWVQFGLTPGSSDLIGFVPIVVTPDMINKTIAIFTAVECKSPGHSTAKDRLELQLNFIAMVKANGGIAMMVESVDEVKFDSFSK